MSPMWIAYWLAWVGALAWPAVLAALWMIRKRVRLRPSLIAAFTLVLTAAWALLGWATLIEPKTLTVSRYAIESPRWTVAPLRIGLISDTHVPSPHVDAARLRRVVERMNAERPDIVFLLGDYAPGHTPAQTRKPAARAAVLEGVRPFAALEAPLGVYAVLGNHDWWFDGPRLAEALEEVGVRVLANSAASVAREGAPFWVIGLEDFESTRAQPSFEVALGRVPRDEPVVALAHWPDVFLEAPERGRGRVALTVAGHSHCGQINLPILGRPVAVSEGARRWPCGAYGEDGRALVVTGGLGVSVLPMRFGAPPEIAIVTLRGEAS